MSPTTRPKICWYETVDSKHLARLVEEYAVDKVPAESVIQSSDGQHEADDYLD